MIDGLIAGKLHGAPVARTGSSGKPFVTAKISAAASGGAAVFVNVIAFSHTVQAALLALDDGDSVALSGTLSPRAWLDRHGDPQPALDMTAHAALTPYHIKRKRNAMPAASGTPAAEPARQPPTHAGGDALLDDEL